MTSARLFVVLVICALARTCIVHGKLCQNKTTYNWTIEKTTRSFHKKDSSDDMAIVSIVDDDGTFENVELDNNTYKGEAIKHKTQLCLSDPVEMKITMDGTNGWGLREIVMVNDDTQQRFIFRCNCFIHPYYNMFRTEKTCFYPGEVDNAYAKMNDSIHIPKDATFTSESSVEFTCKEGYALSSGDSVRNCSDDGQWSGITPVCSVKSLPSASTLSSIETTTQMTESASSPVSTRSATTSETNSSTLSSTETTITSGTSTTETSPTESTTVESTSTSSTPTASTSVTSETSTQESTSTSILTCMSPMIVYNALILNTESITTGGSTSFLKGRTITYACIEGTTLEHGNLVRTCIGENQWSGTPPFCLGTTNRMTSHATRGSSSVLDYVTNASTTPSSAMVITSAQHESTVAYTTSRHQSPIIETTTYTHTTTETSDAVTRHSSVVYHKSTTTLLPVIRGCYCPCSRVGNPAVANMTQVQINAAISSLKEELKVDKSKLSSTIRKKTSAKDDRPSAKAVGCVTGTVIFVIIGAALLIADAKVLVKHFKILLRNVKGS